MQHDLCLVLVLAASAGGLAAQPPIIVPSQAITTAPTVFDEEPQPWIFYGASGALSAARVQYLYDVANISVPSGLLKALRVREPANFPQTATNVDLDVTLAMSGNNSTTMSSTFASNLQSRATRVFKGTVSLPATTPSTWPAPWQAPIAFSAPWPYAGTAGLGLVVDVVARNNTAQTPWWLEGYTQDHGLPFTELYQPQCLHSGGQPSGGYSWVGGGLVPGGTFFLQLNGYPTRTPSLAANVLVFGNQGQGGTFGGVTLPFSLATVGVASPPGCQWSIDIVATAAMTYDAVNGQLRTPGGMVFLNNPWLAGKSFYTQNAALDTNRATGLPEVFPSVALRWQIGTGKLVPASRVVTTFAPSAEVPTTGWVAPSVGVSLQFDQ